MKASVKGVALSLGLVSGIAILVMTLVAQGTGYYAEQMEFLLSVYPGYALTTQGAVIGGVFGFLDGAVGGAVLAWLYNRFV